MKKKLKIKNIKTEIVYGKKTYHHGFTIIELLVVTGILVSLGGLVSGLLVATLRSTSKTKVTTAVSQNGNYALSVITEIVRNSDAIVVSTGNPPTYTSNGACSLPSAPVAGTSQITLHRADGGYTQISCNGNTIASASAATLGNITNSIALTDQSQVSVPSCIFSCQQSDIYTPPIVSVNFSLNDINASAGFEKRLSSPYSFSTQVALYNYSPQ